MKESDILRALKEKNNDVDKASDVLLNLEHLEQTGQRAKGIDAFFAPDDAAAPRRANRRKTKPPSSLSAKSGRATPLALRYELSPPHPDRVDDDLEDGSAAGPARAQREAMARQPRRRPAGADESDEIVAGQSTSTIIDLHHVIVRDGVRIALERTRYWWAHLGEDRRRKARENPLQVVTGIGHHSPRGVSRMYGAVGTALERDGWKVQPGPGHYYVSGKK